MDREVVEVSVVFVGGGPANLAGAIHLSRLIDAHAAKVARGEAQWGPAGPIDKESIVVLEKAADFGTHELSGAVMDPRGLRELFPDFEKEGCPVESPVSVDEVRFLGGGGINLKFPITPPPMTIRRAGIVSIASTSSLSITTDPSNGTCDGRQGCEPVATRKASAVITRGSRPCRVTSMACGPVKRAAPCTVVTWWRARFSSICCQDASTTPRSRRPCTARSKSFPAPTW